MSQASRYRFHEGSIDLPEGFQDRSTHIFVPADPDAPPLNLNIARDTLLSGETLTAYVGRQLGLLQKNLSGYRLLSRHDVSLGSSEALIGEQISATHKSSGRTVHQRQAAFTTSPGRVLIFSCSTARPLTGDDEAHWTQWLASYQNTSNN